MAAHRHHSDILIAGMVVVGMIGWLRLVLEIAGLALGNLPVIDMAGAYLGVTISRRVLADLDLGEAVVAAAVGILLVTGVRYQRIGASPDLHLVVQLVSAVAGAMVGAYLHRSRRAAAGTVGWLLALVAGTAAFGGVVLAVGVTLLVYPAALGLAVIAGAVAGGVIAGRFVMGMRWFHGAVGLCVAFGAVLVTRDRFSDLVRPLIAGGIGGFILGAIGTGVGAWLRPLAPKPELPEVRQVR